MKLIDHYDAALFDLDGVVYLGPAPVDGAAEGLRGLREAGVRIGFVTNNAARTPQTVVDHLNGLGIEAGIGDVVTSSQAGSRLLAERVDPGAKVLVVGTDALVAEVEAVGLTPVSSVEDEPVAVIEGYHPHLPWSLIDEAAYAIQGGALWVATNTDASRPTDRGLVPGAGAQIAALRCAVDVDPLVSGKPCAPLMEETVRRLSAQRPIFVGDRLDTDIEGAVTVGMDSLFVFTGAHGKYDLAAATTTARPTHIGYDLRALLGPARSRTVAGDQAECGDARVRLDGAVARIEAAGDLGERESQLDVLWALLGLCWAAADEGSSVDSRDLLAELNLLP